MSDSIGKNLVDGAAFLTAILVVSNTIAPAVSVIVGIATAVWTIMRICEMVARWKRAFTRWRNGRCEDTPRRDDP